MSSDEAFGESTPPEIRIIAEETIENLLPSKSKEIYELEYTKFMNWRFEKRISSFSETVVLAYFTCLSEKYKSSTLWKIYSMLRTVVNIKHNVNLAVYAKLRSFLKRKSEGYQAKKSQILTAQQISRFIKQAPDEIYLGTKAVMIVGIMGACRKNEMYLMKLQHVEDLGKAALINIPESKTKVPRKFTITGEYYDVFKKYLKLRSPKTETNNLFVNYQKGRCTNQIMGINQLAKMPQQVAKYLNLEESHKYTGHCFRRTSATMLVDGGGDLTDLKRHGGWKSSQVAEGYIENSLENRIKISEKIINHVENNNMNKTAQSSTSHNINSPLYPTASSAAEDGPNVPKIYFQNCSNIKSISITVVNNTEGENSKK